MIQIPIALQMYTLRNESEQDFVGTLEKVAKLGFQGVELAGYHGLTSAELKKVIDSLGLRIASSHIPLEDLEDNLGKVIEDQHVIENNKIVCPYLPPEQRKEEDYRQLVNSLNKIGEHCKQEGITLCYHNHDFELELLSNGKTALEMLLNETNPEWVKAEFDIYWLTRAGHDPVEWIKRYQGRTPLVHLKDMTTDAEKQFAELGTGGVDLHSVLEIGAESGIEWWIIEQDECKNPPLQCVEKSMNYLQNYRNQYQ